MATLVLLVTSNRDDAEAFQNILPKAKDGPFDVEWVTNLSAALTRLKKSDISIVLLNLSLPDSEGIETFNTLFSAAPDVPIMTLASEDEDVMSMEAVELGSQGYISKGNFRNALVPQALRSIIQRKAVEEALFEEKIRAQAILDSIGDAVISTNPSGIVTYLNAIAEQKTGWSNKDAIDLPIDDILRLIDGETRASVQNPIRLVIREKRRMELQGNLVLIRRDGCEFAIEETTAPVYNKRQEVTGAVMIFRDIGPAQATMVRKLTHLAQHDFLTDLPNRVLLIDRLTQSIELAKRNGAQLVVMFLDLDNFKHINDSLGHAVGDSLIKSIAIRLKSCARRSDTVSRQGGDEFILLAAQDMHAEHASHTAIKILDAIKHPHDIEGNELHITTSIGISTYPQDGTDAETLIKNADTAMYHAKKMGRNSYQYFDKGMNIKAVERQSVEVQLRQALKRDEFVLLYQPKVNLQTNTITGAEALIRWHHPTRGMLSPAQFISIAEDCGLIIQIGRWALREACAQAAAWTASGMKEISIAVNISALEFGCSDFLEEVQDILKSTGVNPRLVELELTESVLMRDVDSSAAVLKSLTELGIRIAIDDFGTGYSSLSYLRKFPINVLKIDQSFVSGISQVSHDDTIVRAIIAMGTSLTQNVIAEGIETQEQYLFLREEGCEEGQGYYFSRPLVSGQFEALLNGGVMPRHCLIFPYVR